MDAKVVNAFKDKKTHKLYLIGDIYTASKKRIEELDGLGYVKPEEAEPVEKPEKKKK